MNGDPELDVLLKSIRRLARGVDIYSRQTDREFGLTLPQLIVLRCVRDLGEVTSRAISAEADLSPPTVVGILDKLEGKGLIERYRSTRDRRIVHTRMTRMGLDVIERAPPVFGSEFQRAFGALGKQAQREMIMTLSSVAKMVLSSQDDPGTSSG